MVMAAGECRMKDVNSFFVSNRYIVDVLEAGWLELRTATSERAHLTSVTVNVDLQINVLRLSATDISCNSNKHNTHYEKP